MASELFLSTTHFYPKGLHVPLTHFYNKIGVGVGLKEQFEFLIE